VIATSGSASRLTWLPSCEMDSAHQRWAKFEFRRSGLLAFCALLTD
jgi:hypothetical protein